VCGISEIAAAVQVLLEVYDKDTVSEDDYMAEYRHSLTSPKTILSTSESVRWSRCHRRPFCHFSLVFVCCVVIYCHCGVIASCRCGVIVIVAQLPATLPSPSWETLVFPNNDPKAPKNVNYGKLLVSFQLVRKKAVSDVVPMVPPTIEPELKDLCVVTCLAGDAHSQHCVE
jgi:hypothetical protein